MLCGAHTYECGYKHTNLGEDAGGPQVPLGCSAPFFPPETGSPTERVGL